MKVVVTSQGRNLDSPLDLRFGAVVLRPSSTCREGEWRGPLGLTRLTILQRDNIPD